MRTIINAKTGEVTVDEAWQPDPEPPAPPPSVITRRQLLIALTAAGFLTPEEGIAAARGVVPAAIEAVLDKLPRDTATAARITWATMTTVYRHDPLIEAIISEGIATEEQVNKLFTDASRL